MKSKNNSSTLIHAPLSKTSKAIIIISMIILVATVITGIYYFFNLPNIVPTHYGLNGKVTTYGSKSVFFIPMFLLFGVVVLLLAILHFRYTLIEKYPYLINLPSFVYRLGAQKDKKLQSKVISRVFTVFSLSVLYVSVLNLIITTAIFTQSTSLLLPSVWVAVAVFVVTVILLYRNIYKEFSKF